MEDMTAILQEDEKIIQMYFSRDQSAIAQTEKKYGVKLFHYADSILKNREDAEECVNDTYLKTWESIPPNHPRYFFAYLAKICRHLAFGKLDYKHAKKRDVRLVELTEEMEMCIPGSYQEQTVELEELGKVIGEFLETLPKEKRLIFMRRYWYMDSIVEIAARFHFSESKVKTTLFRTRERFRKYLEKEGMSV